MATLDTLEPQRRAILELLLRQGKGYDDIGGLLDMPGSRVRELAREALVSLEPRTAGRVDEDWRGQVADYVLGQQAAAEARATRGHLKRSEPARAWVSFLLDSLDHLYGDGPRPDVPEPAGGRAARPSREGGGRLAAGAAGATAATAAGRGGRRGDPEHAEAEGTEAEEATAARESSSPGRSAAGPAAAPTRARSAPPGAAPTRARPTPVPEREADRPRALWPTAEAAQRQRVVAGALAAAGLLVAVVVAIALIGGGEDEQDKAQSRPAGGQSAGQAEAQTRLVGQGQLESVGKGDAQGVAVIAERGGQNQLLVQARGLEPSGRRAAYEVWLYNTQRDAVSLGGQVTDRSGGLQGAGPLPPEYRRYRFIDISREKIDRNAEHSGESVLRLPLADLLRGAAAAAPAVPGGGSAP